MTPKPASDDGAAKVISRDRALRLAAEAETMSVRDPRRIAASVAMLERLVEHWSLRGDERETLLGGVPKSTWSEWRQRPAFARIKLDTRERITNLFTIDLNSHALFAPEFADQWVREPSSAFGGESPMSIMLHGRLEDVIIVRRYLERVRSSSATGPIRPDRGAEKTPAVSYLPGDTIDVGDETAELLALRQAAAIYERLGQREPARYRPALAVALSALGSGLEKQGNHAEAGRALRRAFEMQIQLASDQPLQFTSDDLQIVGGPRRRRGGRAWQTRLEPRALNVVMSIGILDPSFNPALFARLREIERGPLQSPKHCELDGARVAHLNYHSMTWIITYVVSEASRCIDVISIQTAPSEPASSSAPHGRVSHGAGTDS